MADGFYFDDFFADESDTVTENVAIKDKAGVERQVPITFKRNMTLQDRKSAELKAIKYEIDEATKQAKVSSVDEYTFVVELLSRLIVAWPFAQRDGSPVPATAENIGKLISDGDGLFEYIQKLVNQKQAALADFGTASDVAS